MSRCPPKCPSKCPPKLQKQPFLIVFGGISWLSVFMAVITLIWRTNMAYIASATQVSPEIATLSMSRIEPT